MFNTDGKHQGSTTTTLCHLAGSVGVAHHERHDARRGEGTVLHGAATGTDMAKIMTHAATTFHQLHLLLVNLHNPAVGVAVALVADDKAVAQRHHLEVVSNTAHGAALRNNILEILQQLVNLFLCKGVLVLLLNTGVLGGQTAVHHVRVQLVDAIVVAQGIFVHPHVGGEFVAMEILH